MIKLPTTFVEADALAFARGWIAGFARGNPWSGDFALSADASRALLRHMAQSALQFTPIRMHIIEAAKAAGDPDAIEVLRALLFECKAKRVDMPSDLIAYDMHVTAHGEPHHQRPGRKKKNTVLRDLCICQTVAFGAYIAARLRAPVTSAADSTEFRDGMHGLVVWALATLLTVLIVLATAQVASRLVAPSGAPSTSAAGENLLAYDLDRLFRSDRRPQGAESNMNYTRTEAGRILLSASSHRGMQADDRTYLVRLVTAMTGLAPADAERRVNDVIAQTKESISRARRSAVIFGFMVGASALLGAVAAWFAACAGGRARDGREELHPLWDWARPVSRW